MNLRFLTPLFILFLGTCTSTMLGINQTGGLRAQKAPITVADMQAWNVIRNEQIGADGRFVLYTLTPDVGDPTAVLYDTRTKAETRLPRLHRARLSYDGTYLVGLLKPGYEAVKSIKLEEKKKAKEKLAKMDSLLVWDLRTSDPEIIPAVRGYKLPERNADIYAYTTTSLLPDSLQDGLEKGVHRLVVRKFNAVDSFYVEGVKEYVVARDAPVVLAHQPQKDSSWEAGALYLDARGLEWQAVSRDAGDYAGLALSNDGRSAAFLTSDPEDEAEQKPFALYHWAAAAGRPRRVSGLRSGDFYLDGRRISNDRTPKFSENGRYLFFGTADTRPERDTLLLDEEIADVEVWRTEDPRLYTQQNVRKSRDEKATYLQVYRVDEQDILSLATDELPYDYLPRENLPRNGNGQWVAVYDDRPYAKESTWTGQRGRRNTEVVNLKTGERKALPAGIVSPYRWLEGGDYLVWYNPTDTTWNSFDPVIGKHYVLTNNAVGTFYDELNDRPMHPRAYGYAGTIGDRRHFIVRDRYDLWVLDAAGRTQPNRITRGRENKTRISLENPQPENRYINSDQPILVTTFHEDNYHGGVGYLDLETKKVNELLSGPKTFGDLLAPRLNFGLLYTRSDFREFPDLYFTPKLDRQAGERISTANPQQANHAWGTNERYEWTDPQGRTLRGMLVKPDGFDPEKKYPLLVNFYERSSEGVFRHRTPTPGRSSINYSHYVSKGYVIFNPDVVYRVGYPGESAYDCVMSGVLDLLDEGFIDRDRIGLQGHSWGGYQGAYIATKTDMFAAIESGAPVVNMFSAYGGIRWGSGLSRQFQYEHTQSRIGGTPWTHFQRYYENSPIFTTDKINTPILILHNDNDGAVPWYQGIEWFTALRRLGKPAWMLNYRGEPHWPVKTANRADFQTRMEQFFDHYLMDAPVPRWMEEGVSPLERGKEQNLETRE